MKITLPELPSWEFEVDEVSAGVYQVIGRSKTGVVISSSATDPDEALASCRTKAMVEDAVRK